MAGPANVPMGDEYGTELPETQVPEQDLVVERNAAKFSKSKEFRTLKDHLERRITHYQEHLPDGCAVVNAQALSYAELGARWMASNVIIAEFKAVIDAYEGAADAVKASGKL